MAKVRPITRRLGGAKSRLSPVPPVIPDSKTAMNKRQLIEEIRRFNVSVQPKFLLQFDERSLGQYLAHLRSASQRDVRITHWVRREPRVRIAS
jgi:hypothetical protein